jgi:beta-glucanase (GH16 family)
MPSGLAVSFDVIGDSSGNVSFTATGQNVAEYEYDFGDGSYEISVSGMVSHRYSGSGNYTVMVTARNSAGQGINRSVQVPVIRNYRLVWADEFDSPGAPSASKWGYDIGTGSGGWGNNELQYYTDRPVNVTVANGSLKINAIKENYSGSAYTSARLLTKDKFSFKYGKLEARAKLPTGIGTWPAIWMLGSNISAVSWPACGEIDIMEHRGSEPNKIYSTVHYPGHSGAGGVGSSIMISNASDSFHIYSVIWDAAAIRFFVDDRSVFSFPNNNTVPFNQDFFIILNLAIGGNFGGAVDPTLSAAGMEIDYIRVFD